jgi:hypothetical protein
MATKRVVRRVNPDKEASRESKKQSASEGVAKARKRSGDATKRREQKAAKRNDLNSVVRLLQRNKRRRLMRNLKHSSMILKWKMRKYQRQSTM